MPTSVDLSATAYVVVHHITPPYTVAPLKRHHKNPKLDTISSTFAFLPAFLPLSFLVTVFLTGLDFFSGAGDTGVSSFPLTPLFLASSSG